MNELSGSNVAMRGEMESMREQMQSHAGQGRGWNNGRGQNDSGNSEGRGWNRQDQNRFGDGGRRRFVKCQKCEQSGAFCNHCSTCGSGTHKKRECSKNE